MKRYANGQTWCSSCWKWWPISDLIMKLCPECGRKVRWRTQKRNLDLDALRI